MGNTQSRIQKLKETLEPMSPQKRLEHLWTYYKWIPILLLAVILFLSSIIPSILESKKNVLFGGMCINVALPQKAQAYLTDDLFVHFGGTNPRKERVTLTDCQMLFNSQDPYGAYAESSTIAAQIAAREIDYILMDATAKDYFAGLDFSTSLEDLLTPQQLEYLQNSLVYRQSSTGERYPFAIDLTQTAFAAACGMDDSGLYVIFPGNTDRQQRTKDFVDYLLNWE